MEKSLLFKIVDDGKEYSIYTNGEIEGFSDQSSVCNLFPFHLRRAEEGMTLLKVEPIPTL